MTSTLTLEGGTPSVDDLAVAHRGASRGLRRGSGLSARARSRLVRAALALLALSACVVSVTLSATLFEGFSVNNDEPVYAFQAKLLLDHRVTLPATPDSQFFRPWMSGTVGDHVVMVFPPVFPALLAVAEATTGSPRAALGLVAAAGVLLAYALARELTGDRRAGLCAGALLAVSPLFVVQSGLFLSYVTALDLELAAAVLLLRGVRRGRRGNLVAAGVVLGTLFFARPLDALLFGLPMVAAAVLVRSRGTAWAAGPAAGAATSETAPPVAPRAPAPVADAALPAAPPVAGAGGGSEPAGPAPPPAVPLALAGRLRGRLAPIALGAFWPMLASLIYNAAVTGNPWRLPLDAIGGDNRPGFGWRRLSSGTPRVHYSFARAVDATAKNLSAIPGWLPGGLVLVALALVGLVRLRRAPWAWGLTALVVTFPLGYLFYWGSLLIVAGRRSIGPHYYLAVLAPVVVFAASELRHLLGRRPVIGTVVALAIAASAIMTINDRLSINERQVALHRQERELIDKAHLQNAIVILPAEQPDGAWLGHPRPSFINDPELRQAVLFATDHGGDNFRLLDDFPARRLYRQFSRTGSHKGPTPTLWKLSSLSAPTLEVHQHIENTGGSPIITVDVSDAHGRTSYLLDAHSTKGRTYDLSWSVSPRGPVLVSPAATPLRAKVAQAPASSGTLVLGAAFGMTTDPDDQSRQEVRYWYRTKSGTVSVMLPGEQWQHPLGVRARWQDRDVASYAVTLQPV